MTALRYQDKSLDQAPALPEATLKERIWEAFGPSPDNWADWKWHLRHRINTAEQLSKVMPLTGEEKREVDLVSRKYPFCITPYYLSLGQEWNWNDPIIRQCVPAVEELAYAEIGEDDPLEEERHSPVPGLVHRYPDRALLILTNICPLRCRHCTRKREWRHGEWIHSAQDVNRALNYIRRTRAIRDVIISGGDPLVLDNARLESILAKLRSIPHVEIIRFGTRFPVVLPQRIDEGFCRLVDRFGPIWLNTHFNHPNEVTPEAAGAVRELLRAGVPVNNQSVLLRGVNDSVETQRRLIHALLRIRVRPYYLYHADEVSGTEHFRTPVERGVEIVEGLIGHTSGLGVPTFVVDVAGGGGKIPLQPINMLSRTQDQVTLRNFEGLEFRLRNPQPAPLERELPEGNPTREYPTPIADLANEKSMAGSPISAWLEGNPNQEPDLQRQ